MNNMPQSLYNNKKMENDSNGQKKWGLSGSTLKLIAVITMLIDHIGAAVLARMLRTYDRLPGFITWQGMWDYFPWVFEWETLYIVYQVMRKIGRIAFPIYCFLLVEGFGKTRNVKKYALRLGMFSLISEVPFDLAFNGVIWDISYQNVFFTLFTGLVVMLCCDRIMQKSWSASVAKNAWIRILLVFFSVAAGGCAAEALHTDYGAKGVICIMVLYLLRNKKPLQLAGGAVSFLWENPAPLAFLPIACYNGRRGFNLKYIFYIFYPLHLFLLYLLCVWLGLGGISAL